MSGSKRWHIETADCLEAMRTLPNESISAIVTDPPYGLSFMGKAWDYDVPSVEIWIEALRVLKPGGYMLAFAGTRTQHRMAVNIEDAGFEIRDLIAWVYGSGFPKSLDVGKAIDKAAGVSISKDGYIPNNKNNTHGDGWGGGHKTYTTPPSTESAKQWNGYGTALKPALEPITVARKPLIGTVAANVLEYECGALNLDECRVGVGGRHNPPASPTSASRKSRITAGYRDDEGVGPGSIGGDVVGRFPANLIHDGSDEVEEAFDAAGDRVSGSRSMGVRKGMGFNSAIGDGGPAIEGSTGSASRFFYTAKTSAAERHLGESENIHPTVKPLALMRYLCRLVKPPVEAVLLDPFCGSGSTIAAALSEGWRAIGIERDPKYSEIAKKRIIGDMPLFNRLEDE